MGEDSMIDNQELTLNSDKNNTIITANILPALLEKLSRGEYIPCTIHEIEEVLTRLNEEHEKAVQMAENTAEYSRIGREIIMILKERLLLQSAAYNPIVQDTTITNIYAEKNEEKKEE